MSDSPGHLRILTWHVHGNYLWYLTQVPHEFHLVTDAARSTHHTGRSGTLPWGENVHDAPVERVRDMDFDLILYQSRSEYEAERTTLLSPAQQRLPAVYLEHDPPLESPTDQRHWADDGRNTLVHVTGFNALMWDHRESPVEIVEHGDRLVDVMRQLVADPALARRWGDAARRTAQERFGIDRFVADWDRLLRRVAAHGSFA